MPPKPALTPAEQRREAKKAAKKAEKKESKARQVSHPVLGRNPEVFCGGVRTGVHWPFEVPVALLDLGLTIPCGWSNRNTHAIISRHCLLNRTTGGYRKEIVGPPVTVDSHFGSFVALGTVRLRVACPDTTQPDGVELDFVVIDNQSGAREGMVGNAAMGVLGVTDVHKYKTQGGYSGARAVPTIAAAADEGGGGGDEEAKEEETAGGET